MESIVALVSERPPHAQELVNCIDRCPMKGKHHVAIHISHLQNTELDPGKYTWSNVSNNTSEYKVANCTFTDISYNVTELLEGDVTIWSWLHELIFGSPDIQTVIMSFTVS